MIFKDQAIQNLPPDDGSERGSFFGCVSEKDALKQGFDFGNGCSDVTGDS